MSADPPHVTANVERFAGFADMYDEHRPRPPAAIVDLLMQLSGHERPVVVDIGSGTGLSTLIWSEVAEAVIGIEPGPDMRKRAQWRAAAAGVSNVRFIDGLSTHTGLADASAGIVTISQALHWMEPDATFAEVARILREGGIFAAYDCDWPPTLNWEAERAYIA